MTAKEGQKTENVTLEYDFKIYEYNWNDEQHEQSKEDNEIEKEGNTEPENNKEETIEKDEDIKMIELQSEDEIGRESRK